MEGGASIPQLTFQVGFSNIDEMRRSDTPKSSAFLQKTRANRKPLGTPKRTQ